MCSMIDKKDPNAVFNSKILHEEFAKEREKKGLYSMQASNNGEGRLARKDKSWSSIPDFFVKLFKSK